MLSVYTDTLTNTLTNTLNYDKHDQGVVNEELSLLILGGRATAVQFV